MHQQTDLKTQELTESAARYYPRVLPMVIDTAQGSWVTATDGRRYLDFLAGAGTLALGHNHPEVTAALRATLDRGAPLHTLDFFTPEKSTFIEQLRSALPGDLGQNGKLHF
ncbi:aminotransferase class III-fold pyridoxal phosphate-dependent enzyme [Corynebacterium sp. TAE3-ERU16]|nr:aminotransferase class III-fold pyridoxal phosphate-dependent enzyme [Corynebacterium sp. TAE3-ERU16]